MLFSLRDDFFNTYCVLTSWLEFRRRLYCIIGCLIGSDVFAGLGNVLRPRKKSEIALTGNAQDTVCEMMAPQFYQVHRDPYVTYSTDYALIDCRATLEGTEVPLDASTHRTINLVALQKKACP